ncbi:MAG TPA: 1-(5-phosphoribosyl)-5-[(5-phosphoribosylamino)methylideneamino]imidazole-4-carboxamide isomerase [Chloroflexota bacterium]|nr:1-(5-phosphoribosyl)-5-[(5-phosphoribosylamino)methylideneamino]imidazole-4-carboxamide isomerase [Chloroflexota bacterium]
MSFVILPSIDVRAGRVVDLYQGDFAKETVFDESAEAWARRFVEAGAAWIHVVDLDGSRDGTGRNRALVAAIGRVAHAAGAQLELGGGIRSLDAIEAARETGADRVVIGTAAVENPQLVEEAVTRFGAETIAVGIDSREGIVTTRGWTEGSGKRTTELAREMEQRGCIRLICTDVTRDSTLTAPNFESLREIASATKSRVIASGGVTTVEQIRQLREGGLEGAIVGSALYAGRLTLEEALAAARGEVAPV